MQPCRPAVNHHASLVIIWALKLLCLVLPSLGKCPSFPTLAVSCLSESSLARLQPAARASSLSHFHWWWGCGRVVAPGCITEPPPHQRNLTCP